MRKKTVFVLGAGASAKLGLPLGSSLKSDLSKSLTFIREGYNGLRHGNPILYTTLQRQAEFLGDKDAMNRFVRASARIAERLHLAPSIDSFLHVKQADADIVMIGKLAIAERILSGERATDLCQSQENMHKGAFKRMPDTWHRRFFEQTFGGVRPADLADVASTLCFVIFNYDRCFEHFLFHAIKDYFEFSNDSDVVDILNRIETFHVYGQVGRLAWQLGEDPAVPFGAELQTKQLLAVSTRIRTFTETTREQKHEIERIQALMHEARHTVFLGYGFHKINNTLLYGPAQTTVHKQPMTVFSTAHKDVSEFERAATQKIISDAIRATPSSLHWYGDCEQLFDDCGRGFRD